MEMTPLIFAQAQPASPAVPIPSAPAGTTTTQPATPTTATSPQQPNPFMTFAPLILIFAIMYFIMIRPEQRRKKEHQKLLAAIKPGDKVITTGGMFGVIANVKDKTVMVKIADNVKVEMQKGSVQTVLGTDSSAEKVEKA